MSKRARSPVALSRGAGGEDGTAEGLADERVAASSTPTLHRPPKRHRVATTAAGFSLEGSLSEEILLRCLSYLPVEDLITITRVSSAWHRLAQDPQLWRSLYLSTFASASSSRSLSSPSRTRPWRELFKISSNWRRGNARAGTIGRTMRKSILADAPEDLSIAGEATPPLVQAVSQPNAEAEPDLSRPTDTILQFHQQFFFTASRTPSPAVTPPAVTVHQTLPSGESPLVGSITSPALLAYFTARPSFRPHLAVTELRLDEHDAHGATSLRLAVFYSTGQFALFRLHLPTTTSPFSFDEIHTHLALSTVGPLSSTFDPTALARFHSPLLATCSRSLVLRFWRIEEREGITSVEEIEPSLRSRESWAPVVLTLKKVEGGAAEDERDEWGMRKGEGRQKKMEEVFKVTLAYSTPIFPEGWSVGVQEFVVRIPPLPAPSTSIASTLDFNFRRPRASITTRHAIAPSTTQYIPHPSRRQQQLVTAIEHSDPFIVTSRSDNTLDVFEVISETSSSPHAPSHAFNTLHLRNDELADRIRIVHRRTLFGHTARVASVAIEEGGRCVSGGDDGTVKVWQLGERSSRAVDVVEEEAQEAEPEPRSVWKELKAKRAKGKGSGREKVAVEQVKQPSRIRRVLFDEDKIVTIVEETAGAGESVRLLRFD
ncbi:hypothetical protein BCR35DRAFT_354767 [Leucosporidium creatinivorum]|uniref:F-box domain-containing protein n=1 Tax=Leucosporidium creatinivorum TaxID=106004 RepID=A0A1Y2E945_9BASI|nr:hypothetical protein BCR35DRAFT_354767 [Leucosporidium creatinivorum]